MLPAAARMRHRHEFDDAVRRGRRVTTTGLTVHLASAVTTDDAPDDARAQVTPRIGFVVSRRTGSAVARNKVRRRLRHIARDRLDRLYAEAPGSALVIQAKPAAAGATSHQLAGNLDQALDKLLGNKLLGKKTVS